MKILRKIFGQTKEADNTWRIKTNDKLNKSIQNRNIINYIRAQRLSWFEHIHRMVDHRLVNMLFKWKPIASRSQGRPKNRWKDDVLNDIKLLGINDWKRCIHN
jgi:hypothetical protein